MAYLSDTIEVAKSLGVGTHGLVVESGVFEGQMAKITISEDGSASTFMEGGMWIVKGMWTVSSISTKCYQQLVNVVNLILPPHIFIFNSSTSVLRS